MSTYKRSESAIGFPPPWLGEAPVRLPILAQTDEWLALEKPSGFGTRAHPWDGAPDLDAALNGQLSSEKPELLKTGARLFGSVYYLDPVISGVAVFAKNRDALTELRNQFGSGECAFTFHLVAFGNKSKSDGTECSKEFRADAPLLRHRVKPKMIPSTAKGKKSFTDFKKLSEAGAPGDWAFWEARVRFFRPHQVRAHAATHGIPVSGDGLYDGPAVPSFRELQQRTRRSDADMPIFDGLAIHLSRVELNSAAGGSVIEAPLPKPFTLLLKRLGLANPL